MPVSNAMRPPISIATKMPLPALAVAAPKDVNSPVPTIIAAVSNTAVIFPILLLVERADLYVAAFSYFYLVPIKHRCHSPVCSSFHRDCPMDQGDPATPNNAAGSSFISQI